MRQPPKKHRSTGLNRREFLGVGAIPLAAGLAASDFGAKRGVTEDEMKTMQSAQAVVRVGIIGAGGIVQRAQLGCHWCRCMGYARALLTCAAFPAGVLRRGFPAAY